MHFQSRTNGASGPLTKESNMDGLLHGWVRRGPGVVVAAALLLALSGRAHADCNEAENTCIGVGALRANGSGTANSAFGFGALQNNTRGAGNTAIGNLAMFEGAENTQNTAVGQYAMRRANDAWQNTAVGLLALAGDEQPMTGSYNVGVGAFSLLRNTTGSNNVAIGNASMIENTTGFTNVAIGSGSLNSNTTGYLNVALGPRSLARNTTGKRNVAVGGSSLYGLGGTAGLTGSDNTAVGYAALLSDTTGYANVALGSAAMWSESSGHRNTGIGTRALFSASTGKRNVALGYAAGHDITTGSDNIILGGGNRGSTSDNGIIRIGTAKYQFKAYIAGVHGVQPARGGAVPVMIDGNGQLGTLNSSQRFKQDITPMGREVNARLLLLKPVTYRYTQAHDDGSQPLEYGLIAEEVAGVFPDLVVYDAGGQPLTVRYHLLASMLVDALQREHAASAAQAARLDALEKQVAGLLQGR
jgi:trimeric autotransporter adhesin